MQNSKSQVETKVKQSDEVDVTTSGNNAAQTVVSGSFKVEAALERLIGKWYSEAEKINELTKPSESKHQRQVANHFLIQLYKCIGDAEVELNNCR